ncbi:GGDEF domain-containing response regulator [Pseudothauera lacus]|uniref:PAS domain S-box protein n=1 Tax=Pseudothauera lacus TaxID=2136175 RepID=A0A2T4IGX3_9RHOO|nr:diguanylate cyclase [Pseudothauera lacus]PTD97018.1 PAS domain S-box protein [Pseudothauera lacus]
MKAASTNLDILLVDDEQADAFLVRKILRDAQFAATVAHCSDGIEALDALRRRRNASAALPDLILLDLNMPRMDGHEFLAALAREEGCGQIPVVVLSTSSAELDMDRASAGGARGYLTKQADLRLFSSALLALVRQYLQQAELPPRARPPATPPRNTRILLVDDEAADAELVAIALRKAWQGEFELVRSETLGGVSAQLGDRLPDLVLLDLGLPDASGLHSIERMRALVGRTPIVVLTGNDDSDFALEALAAGAQDYLFKSRLVAADLVRAMRHAIARSQLEERLAESEERMALALAGAELGMWDWDITRRQITVDTRWAAMLGESAGVLAVDAQGWLTRAHPEDLGAALNALNSHFRGLSPGFRFTHRLRHLGGGWVWTLAAGKVLQRDGCGRPLRAVGIMQDIGESKRMEADLLRLATTDALTTLSNRRVFVQRLAHELARIRRHWQAPSALMMLDLDHFKRINDRWGHQFGDRALCHFSTILRSCLRECDLPARLGGEEFAVLLPGTDAQAAMTVARRIREQLAQQPLAAEDETVGIRVSIGVTTLTAADPQPEACMSRADAALYRAKQHGRNREEFIEDDREHKLA